MDALECIHTRRSVRTFEPRPLSQDMIDELLHAAMAAPSAGNQQPWHFILVDDPVLRERLSHVSPYTGMLAQAALGVAVCAEPAKDRYKDYWIIDCAAATQNLLLAARALGLGAVWLGVHPVAERKATVREVLGLPAEIEPHSLIAIGWPAVEQRRVDRFKPERVHHNAW